MNTAIKSGNVNRIENKAAANVNDAQLSLSALFDRAENYRFGIIALLLVVVTCMAGMAAAVAVNQSTFSLALVAAAAMAAESMVLAVASMRAVIISAVISVIVSTVVFLM